MVKNVLLVMDTLVTWFLWMMISLLSGTALDISGASTKVFINKKIQYSTVLRYTNLNHVLLVIMKQLVAMKLLKKLVVGLWGKSQGCSSWCSRISKIGCAQSSTSQVKDVNLRLDLIKEAKIGAVLHHPDLVETSGMGEDNDCLYIAMELVEGISLRTAQ